MEDSLAMLIAALVLIVLVNVAGCWMFYLIGKRKGYVLGKGDGYKLARDIFRNPSNVDSGDLADYPRPMGVHIEPRKGDQ